MTEIRLAEDQMQRLLECIHGVNLVPKPKPDPGQVKASGEGWVDPYDKVSYVSTLETQIGCLQSNLDYANDRAHKAEREVESLRTENEDLKKRLTKLTVLNDTIQAQVPKERACVILRPYGGYYELLMTPIIFGDRESATKWAKERGLEVIE